MTLPTFTASAIPLLAAWALVGLAIGLLVGGLWLDFLSEVLR